jgi:dihydrofolate reductase
MGVQYRLRRRADIRFERVVRATSVREMGRIIVSEFLTLDGVMQDPGGAEGFHRGGWAFLFDRGAEGDQYKVDETMAAETLLLGRATYEGFAAAWPERTGEFADKTNGMPKVVVSTTLAEPTWTPTAVVAGDVVAELARRKEASTGDMLVAGSAQLVQTLLANDLVDELRLMVFPIVLGAGKRLFTDTAASRSLRLAEVKPVGPAGVVVLTYRPVAAE